MIRIPLVAAALVVVVVVQGSCTDSGQSLNDEQEVRATLAAFIRAFENGDLHAMEASFAEDALTFPRAIMSSEHEPPIRTSEYRRVTGLDPQMRMLIALWREGESGPPYMSLEPKDLEVQMFTEAAVATFHLEDDNTVSRRTFVLAKREGGWKIVHLHASNVVGSQ